MTKATKQLSDHAAVAAIIRRELKQRGIRGRVKSSAYSGGTSVSVHVTDLPPAQCLALREFCSPYEYGSFDGMTDCYEYTNARDDIPQVKYLFVDNEASPEMERRVWDYCRGTLAEFRDAPEELDGSYWTQSLGHASDAVWQVYGGRFGTFWPEDQR